MQAMRRQSRRETHFPPSRPAQVAFNIIYSQIIELILYPYSKEEVDSDESDTSSLSSSSSTQTEPLLSEGPTERKYKTPDPVASTSRRVRPSTGPATFWSDSGFGTPYWSPTRAEQSVYYSGTARGPSSPPLEFIPSEFHVGSQEDDSYSLATLLTVPSVTHDIASASAGPSSSRTIGPSTSRTIGPSTSRGVGQASTQDGPPSPPFDYNFP